MKSFDLRLTRQGGGFIFVTIDITCPRIPDWTIDWRNEKTKIIRIERKGYYPEEIKPDSDVVRGKLWRWGKQAYQIGFYITPDGWLYPQPRRRNVTYSLHHTYIKKLNTVDDFESFFSIIDL